MLNLRRAALVMILTFPLVGCRDPFRIEFKCKDGVIYTRENGAWIQALMYEKNKCLPEDEK